MATTNALDAQPLALCLEFANTVHWHASNKPYETLHKYSNIVDWVAAQDRFTEPQARMLHTLANTQEQMAEILFARGITLREAIYRVFAAIANQRQPEQVDIVIIDREYNRAVSQLHLERADEGFQIGWGEQREELDRPLWPIARAAAELLASKELLARVGQCADDRGCGWLFLDLSKNHSRRWCDINDCGNRAKQRRHYQRSRGE